jgi:hypothetical protein
MVCKKVIVSFCLIFLLICTENEYLVNFAERTKKPSVSDLNFILQPSQTCPTFLIVTTQPGGLGHRFISLAIAISFVLRASSNATLILDVEYFSQGRIQGGESLDFAVNLLGLQSILTSYDIDVFFRDGSKISDTTTFTETLFETRWGFVRPVAFDSVEDAIVRTSSMCGIVSLLPCDTGCRHDDGTSSWCAASEHAEIASARPLLSQLFATQGNSNPSNLRSHAFHSQFLEPYRFNVVWHVRNDDIILSSGPESISRTIDIVTVSLIKAGVVGHHWIISQNPIENFDQNFGIFHSHPGFNATFLTSLSTTDAFLHLAYADILIHSGSSFALSAAIVAHSSQVFLYGQPKESTHFKDHAWRAQYLPGCVPILPDGSFTNDDTSRLIELIKTRAKYRLIE